MATLHEAAAKGSLLTPDHLKTYGQSADSGFLDALDAKGRTALSYAAFKGHVGVVKLLVDQGADVKALSKGKRSALWYAAASSMSRQKRLDIMAHLLDKDPTAVDLQAEDGSTALMKVIVDHRDPAIISFLVDRNASTAIQNKSGDSAQSLAKKTNDQLVIRALKARRQRSTSRGKLVDKIVGYILFVVAAANAFLKNFFKKLFNIKGKDSAEIRRAVKIPKTQVTKDQAGREPATEEPAEEQAAEEQATEEPTTKEEEAKQFTGKMNHYLEETGLSEFFAENDTFLQEVAAKATKVKEDPSNPLRRDDDINNLTTIALYQPIIYCDDSGSMKQGTRAQDQIELVRRIARISTRIVPDGYGTGLQFINSNSPLDTNLSAEKVDEILAGVKPSSGTRIGTSLKKKILDPLVYDVLNKEGGKLERPILISCITDGDPTGESSSTFKTTILDCISFLEEKGYEATAVRFQISQIGNDPDAEAFLRKLVGDSKLQGVLYCTSQRLDDEYKRLKQNDEDLERWLLKTLLAPVMGPET